MIRDRPYRPADVGDDELALGHHLGERRRLKGRVHVGEVEGQVELIAGAVKAAHRSNIEHVGLSKQDPSRVVAVGQAAPVAEHIVDLRPLHVVDVALAMCPHMRGIRIGGDRIVP